MINVSKLLKYLVKAILYVIMVTLLVVNFAGNAAIYEQTKAIISNQHVLLDAIKGTPV